MEAWPTVAWILFLTTICDQLKTIQSRDFTMKDIVLLHPSNTRYCYTLHMMDKHGDSVSVSKRCATLENCRFTGCMELTDNGYQQVCTSCCEGNICNVLVPRNNSSAIFSSTSPLVSSSRRLRPAAMLLFIIIMISSCTAG
ncbi:ly6/PLAUR domain-containing protein 6 isoform X3 [Melanotaenia boesemani]|uniref:ly6/PLAUR domain-containing protein 6 isoform X3 n=1 Tax=Melanotaenia boesemani TaxID=1250792 RepID=UPI001C05DD8D|nr:ly6/PLAUR domain-containing protein 6 isoform X3 [Melanotaenia boesemani]